MPKVLGIDLGTTNSCMAVIEAGEPIILENSEGGRTTPSVVAINPRSGERYVGTMAKRQAVTNPENTISAIKRFMGRRYSEDTVQGDSKLVPYKVTAGQGEAACVTMSGKEYSPPEISAMILRKLKEDAEKKVGESITQAVITVPAYFNDSQRQATKDAGVIAGLEVLRIINEPTAASLAYGMDKQGDRTIAVYDLGGGTFDISILELGEGLFEVKATNGDTHLGGDDFDQRIIDWICDEFRKEQGIDLKQDRMALQRLKEAAEKAKVELSSVVQTEINLPFITADASGPKHLVMSLTRSSLEQMVGDLIDRAISPCRQALDDAGIQPSQIDEVILVGGQTRMPAVAERVQELFGREPHKGVNPDEVVALGAAIQAGVLKGEVRDILLLDVTPLTLGIETLGSVMTSIIKRNTTIPTSHTETFTTAADGQASVEVHTLQGERPMATENRSIGRFILDGIIPAPRGVPQIDVTFDIDANGILNVQARDKGTGKEQRITITSTSGLPKEEVDRLLREAELHAQEDQSRREEVETRNTADALVYNAEKMLRDHGDKVSQDLKDEVASGVASLRSALQQGDMAAIRQETERLSQTVQKVGTAAIDSSGEEDYFSFQARAGTTYTIQIILGSLGDSVLRILDSQGQSLAYNDDYRGLASLISYTPRTSETLYIVVGGFSQAYTGSYELSIYEGFPPTPTPRPIPTPAPTPGPDDHANSIPGATLVLAPSSTSGVIGYPVDQDFFSFEAEAGDTYTIETTLVTLGDSTLTLYDASGLQLAFNDDYRGLASRITYTATASETIYVAVQAWSSCCTGSYTLSISVGETAEPTPTPPPTPAPAATPAATPAPAS